MPQSQHRQKPYHRNHRRHHCDLRNSRASYIPAEPLNCVPPFQTCNNENDAYRPPLDASILLHQGGEEAEKKGTCEVAKKGGGAPDDGENGGEGVDGDTVEEALVRVFCGGRARAWGDGCGRGGGFGEGAVGVEGEVGRVVLSGEGGVFAALVLVEEEVGFLEGYGSAVGGVLVLEVVVVVADGDVGFFFVVFGVDGVEAVGSHGVVGHTAGLVVEEGVGFVMMVMLIVLKG